MIRRILILAVAAVLVGAVAIAQQEKAEPKSAEGHHFFVYPTNGTPLVVHLHGVQGEIHVWVVTEKEPQVNEEAKKLELIRKAFPQKSQ